MGRGTYGRLGHNGTYGVSSPVLIVGSHKWTELSLGYESGHGIKDDGTLWGWGRSTYGSSGINATTPDISSPVQINSNTDWITVDASKNYAGTIGAETHFGIRKV